MHTGGGELILPDMAAYLKQKLYLFLTLKTTHGDIYSNVEIMRSMCIVCINDHGQTRGKRKTRKVCKNRSILQNLGEISKIRGK